MCIAEAIDVAIVGGVGHWSKKTHVPGVLDAKELASVRLLAIIDYQSPYDNGSNEKLRGLCRRDNTEWINPRTHTDQGLLDRLDAFHNLQTVDLLIIACDPQYHLFYIRWALRRNIRVLCDKPPIVLPHCASDPVKADAIGIEFDGMARRLANKDPLFVSLPLRRRAMEAYIDAADSFARVHSATGIGVSNGSVIVDSGVLRFPSELGHGGAHGYTCGFGSLSHSAYHFIDILAWFLTIARGTTRFIELSMPYVFRVRDYLASHSSRSLEAVLSSEEGDDSVTLDAATLAAELDSVFHILLLNNRMCPCGSITLSCKHVTQTTRLLPRVDHNTDPANHELGGRMSHAVVDLHQGGLQAVTIHENHESMLPRRLSCVRRCHPNLGDREYWVQYDQHRKPRTTPVSLVSNAILLSAGKLQAQSLLASLLDQRLTMALYSACYGLVARANVGEKTIIRLDLTDLNARKVMRAS
jgi:hypothetical protein